MSASAATATDVLVVEDSRVYAAAFRKILAGIQCSCAVVSDAETAVEWLGKSRARVLLLDWVLPKMDGPTLCRRLREQASGSYVYIILITSNSRVEEMVRGFEAGADDYIVKPPLAPVLQAKVRVGLRLSNLEQKLAQEKELLAAANEEQEKLIRDLRDKNRIITERTDDLHQAQKQLLDTARRAGMAEIATSVLHNAGNLLNSAMTSSAVIQETLAGSRIGTLKKLADFLPAEKQAFLDFVATDPRGGDVAAFVQQLAQALGGELRLVGAKLGVLSESLDQIRQIIALQQSYAGLAGVKETVAPPSLLEDAVQLFLESFKRHDITIRYDYAPDLPSVAVEKQKVLQILMNLLKNARDATMSQPRDQRCICLRVHRPDEEALAIEVNDNGGGIKPENLSAIFNFGFTTKTNGHGFGLHGSANLAREMGGSLEACSPGEGRGATFTLTLPIS